MIDIDTLADRLKAIRRDIRSEYLEQHSKPWIIGFSGGKDSTLLTHLVIETLLTISPDERTRPVYLVCNDTLVESPVFHSFVQKMLTRIEENIGDLNVPVRVVRTHPLPEESFWVNLLGRGYPAPNRTFRWCTDRMKIRPTSRFIRDQVSVNGEAILLLGVRYDESSQRAGSIARHSQRSVGRLSPHGGHKGVWVYSPIQNLNTQEVWLTLISARALGAANTMKSSHCIKMLLAANAPSSSAMTMPLRAELAQHDSDAGHAQLSRKTVRLNH